MHLESHASGQMEKFPAVVLGPAFPTTSVVIVATNGEYTYNYPLSLTGIPCVPNPDACRFLGCGYIDDRCGGVSCGSCGSNETCQNNQCFAGNIDCFDGQGKPVICN